MCSKLASTVPLRLDRQQSISTSATDVTFAGNIRVGVFALTGQIAFALNIRAQAQKRVRSEDYCTLPSEREGAQHYRSTNLPVYGIGRSFETFGWVPPVTVGWGETSGFATLWGCSMVHRGKNIVNGNENPQFLLVMCALCPHCACFARPVRALCTSALLNPVQVEPDMPVGQAHGRSPGQMFATLTAPLAECLPLTRPDGRQLIWNGGIGRKRPWP